MTTIEHVKSNAVSYLVAVVILPLAGGGLVAYLDARHEPIGTSLKAELRGAKRAKRELENYESYSPSEQYSPARQATIRELEDEIAEIEMELRGLE